MSFRRKLVIAGVGLVIGAGIGAAFLTRSLPTPSGEHYTVMLRGGDDPATRFWWNADYFRSLPYTSATGWTDGDRAAYKCLYGFLLWRDRIAGRVTFTRVMGATYALVNDEKMVESSRHYVDGSLGTPENPVVQSECPAPDQSYEPYLGPDERPVVTYETNRGRLLEVRDYKQTVAGLAIKFRLADSTPQRVTVVAYFNDQPAIVIYYDSMMPRVVMNGGL